MGKASGGMRNPLPAASRWTLAAAVAAVVVLGALVVPGTDGVAPALRLPESAEPGWGEAWGASVQDVGAATAEALGARVTVVAVGVGALLGLALLTALFRLVGEREAVRPSLAVRWALGRSPRELGLRRLRDAAGPVARAVGIGVAVGLPVAGALRWSWPADGVARTPSPLLLLALPLLLVPVALAVLWPVAGIEERSPDLLRVGRGGTDDPKAGTVRRAAATLQLAAAAALVLAGATLGADVRGGLDGEGFADGDTVLVPLRPVAAGLDWAEVERLLGATSAESLSTPGAWTGRGVRDLVTVECGACSRGGLPLPIYGVRATLHAVSPGFFAAADLEVLAGRGFTDSDDADAGKVGVVSAAFARDHFEGGRPIGKHVRLSGGDGQRWLTIVGVVEEMDFAAPGSPVPGDPVLWVPLAQHTASEVVWSTAEGRADALPVDVPVAPSGPPETLTRVRARARSPLRWTGAVLLSAGVVGLILALAAGAETARAEVRGRWREAAIRASMGARPHRLALRYLRRAAGTALAGGFVGWVLAWSVVETFGSGAGIPVAGGGGLVALLLGATLAGAWSPARRAATDDPSVLLRAEG